VTAPITTVIADDEVLARRNLRALLANQDGIHLVGECRDGHEVVATLRELAPELLFLDIHMPGLDGFGALARAASLPVTVFVTAHEQHALRAFDADAVDYLLKPFGDERFLRALHRARLEVQRRRMVELASTPVAPPARRTPPRERSAESAPGDRIAVKDGRGVELVEAASIDWITALGYYAELHIAGRSILLREPLQDLETRLDPARFVRIHRSTIVNVDRISRLDRLPHGDFDVVLTDGTHLRMSRARRDALERVLPPR
jgi:two-component system LytT family response regulator